MNHDPFTDRQSSPLASVQGAWQRAAAKHGTEYADIIFPAGKPATGSNQKTETATRKPAK